MDFMIFLGVVGWVVATMFALLLVSMTKDQDRAAGEEQLEVAVRLRMLQERLETTPLHRSVSR